MNIKRAKYLIRFVESLSREDKGFIRQLVVVETEAQIVSRMERRKKRGPYRKRKQKHNVYDDGQIHKAFELKSKGVKNNEIERLTGVKRGSLANPTWLKDRFNKLMELIPANDKKKTF